jgi:DNA-binding beta-propeller fold protein YncE
MRMKFYKSSQLLLVSAVSLLAAGVITACGTATTDFVYVASSKAAGPNSYGEIDVFEINAVSGAMRQIPASPFPSGGRNPVAEAVSSDYKALYVVNHDDNTIVQFLIGSDGKLYPQNTVNTPGIYPLAVAVSGSNLFVVDTYQPLSICSNAEPCSGAVAVFPILTAAQAQATVSPSAIDNTLGPPVANGSLSYWPLNLVNYTASGNSSNCETVASTDVITPTAANVLAWTLSTGTETVSYLYLTAYDTATNAGYVFGFTVGSGGALVPLNCGVPFPAGVHPSAIASDSTSGYVYVTDATSGNVLGYSVASGVLTPLAGSPFEAGNQPSAIAVDPKYSYAYVTNLLDGTVSAYSIGAGGALSRIGTYTSGVQPVAIGIDPSTNHFVFTANFLGNGANSSVSDFQMSTTDGTLINTQHSPYTANSQLTAVAAIPHKATN